MTTCVVDFYSLFENTTGENTKQITDINACDLTFKPPFGLGQHVGSP